MRPATADAWPAPWTTGVHRLATTLLDHHRYPAFELVRRYHERWEVESAYFNVSLEE